MITCDADCTGLEFYADSSECSEGQGVDLLQCPCGKFNNDNNVGACLSAKDLSAESPKYWKSGPLTLNPGVNGAAPIVVRTYFEQLLS